MTTLQIYDSQGERLDSDGAPEVSQRIENFFFGGVRLYLETGRQTELVAFFRARESKAGRANQYYAVYRTDDTRQLFERFKTALRRRVEDEYGMTLQTTSDDVELFANLDGGTRSAPGDRADHEAISTLLSRGERLRFGVRSTDDALGLAMKYVQGPATTIAIAEKTDIDELANCDLAIELGRYGGLEPLGETEDRFDSVRYVGSADGTDGRAGNTSRPKAGIDEDGGGSRLSRTLLAAVGVIGLALIATVAVAATAAMGIGPAAGLADSVFGDEASEATLDATLEADESHAIVDDGEFEDSVDVTVANGSITITGTTNQDLALVALVIDGETVHSESRAIGNRISISLDHRAGSGELRIAVGDDATAADWMADDDWSATDDWAAVADWAAVGDSIDITIDQSGGNDDGSTGTSDETGGDEASTDDTDTTGDDSGE